MTLYYQVTCVTRISITTMSTWMNENKPKVLNLFGYSPKIQSFVISSDLNLTQLTTKAYGKFFARGGSKPFAQKNLTSCPNFSERVENWLCPNFLSLPKKSELPKIWGGCSPPRPPGPYAYGWQLATLILKYKLRPIYMYLSCVMPKVWFSCLWIKNFELTPTHACVPISHTW